MNSEQYKAAFDAIVPQEELIQSTLAAIAVQSKKKTCPSHAIDLAMTAVCVVAVLCLFQIPLGNRNQPAQSETAMIVSSIAETSSAPLTIDPSDAPSFADDTSHQVIVTPVPSQTENSTPPTSAAESPAGISSDSMQSIALPGLHINEISNRASQDKRYYPEDQYDTVTWSREQFVAHWGKDIVPSSLPADLTEFHPRHGGKVVLTKGGEPVYDLYHFTWAEHFEEAYDPLRRSVTLSVSALGMAKDAVYQIDEPILSDIGGVEVMFGHCSMSYGPYDPDTHLPAGEYDLYVAEFSLDGIDYQLTTENLTLEEAQQVLVFLLQPAG